MPAAGPRQSALSAGPGTGWELHEYRHSCPTHLIARDTASPSHRDRPLPASLGILRAKPPGQGRGMVDEGVERAVMTVLGPVDARELGLTLMHEHLFIDRARILRDDDYHLHEMPLAVRELSSFVQAGGATVVEVTNHNLARDPDGLVEVARRRGSTS
nr:hypothetical protein [Streptomyces sp. 1114.5]